MTAMKPELLAALHASLDAGGWRAVGVSEDEHEEQIPGDPSAAPPTAPSVSIERHMTMQIENVDLGLMFVVTLAGDNVGYSSVKLSAMGGSFETDDAALIARLSAAAEPASDAIQDAIIAKLQA